ncbi:brain protein I3-like [Acanthaster planci]|uniref:Membrane protein BRI3 n=1 Tax=Acanthaster planci TaxID=133434 RepID=A0A8B7YIZ5_ACAPL|nr:brain protein I3-like [Acanthaster planci]
MEGGKPGGDMVKPPINPQQASPGYRAEGAPEATGGPPIAGGYPPAGPGGYQSQPGSYPPQGYPAQQGYPPPGQSGYPPQHQGYPAHQQPPTVVTVQQQPATTQVVMTGGCPTCHVGVMTDSYTACGIILAICFFPLGIICCLMMKERTCSNCGATFG